ncbi:MAG: hypothetical protein M1838_001689 [Thelocarpon superellum]|nr:MAG: hypothetical protein M1838_001689 [Thelocarpon superellum]
MVILRGRPSEAASVALKGHVQLHLSAPLTLKRIVLTLIGTCKISWPVGVGPDKMGWTRRIKAERRCYGRTWNFAEPSQGNTETLPAGTYVYPFEHIFPGATAESVEGWDDAWIVYRFKATVERSRLASKIVARKHVRVVRTFEAGDVDATQTSFVERDWPNTMNYNISLASRTVPLGGPVQFSILLMPQAKDIAFGLMKTWVVEKRTLSLTAKARVTEREIGRLEFNLEEELESQTERGEEGWRITRCIPLPASLVDCMQDVDIMGIEIKHDLFIIVPIINADGTASVIRARLPFVIVIPPHLIFNEENQITNHVPVMSHDVTAEELVGVPPSYGQHREDRLWSEIDLAGYNTPAGPFSRSTTPRALSRRASAENLGPPSPGQRGDRRISPQTLQERLANVALARPRDPSGLAMTPMDDAAEGSSSASGVATPAASGPATPSDEHVLPLDQLVSHPHPTDFARSRAGHADSPESNHSHHSAAYLFKLPSYNTVVGAPAGPSAEPPAGPSVTPPVTPSVTPLGASPSDPDPPDYETAMQIGPRRSV